LPSPLTGLASLIAAITGWHIATDGFKQATEQSAQPAKKMLLDEDQHQQQIAALRQASRQRVKNTQQEAQQQPRTDPQSPAINISGNRYLTNGFGTFTFVLGQTGTQITLQEFDAISNAVGTGQGFIDGCQVFLS
jgi:hypothetical protein